MTLNFAGGGAGGRGELLRLLKELIERVRLRSQRIRLSKSKNIRITQSVFGSFGHHIDSMSIIRIRSPKSILSIKQKMSQRCPKVKDGYQKTKTRLLVLILITSVWKKIPLDRSIFICSTYISFIKSGPSSYNCT